MNPRIAHGSWTVLFMIALLSRLAASSAAPSATLTTLPPALPTGNNTDPCSFTDRYSLIDRVDADWRGYNVSLLVATCEGVCPLVYGAGNPDISGIGAMTSYIIQAIITTVFGPILALLCILYDIDLAAHSDESLDRPSRFWVSAGEIAQSTQTGNILTALAFVIASIIRIQQLAPVAELNFIKDVAMYQYMISYAVSISYFSVFGKSLRLCLLAFYTCVVTGMFFAIQFMNGYPSSKTTILDTITWYCVSDWDYPIPNLYIAKPSDDKFDLIFWLSYTGGLFLLGIILFFINKYLGAWLLKVYHALKNSFAAFCERLHIKPKRLLVGLTIVTLTTLWAFITVFFIFALQQQRKQLQLLSGNTDQDSEWGFGQITAVLLWAPVFNDMILSNFEYVHSRRVLTQPETHEMQTPAVVPPADLPAPSHAAHVRNAVPQLTSGSVPRNNFNETPCPSSQDMLVARQQDDLESRSDRSIGSSDTEPVEVLASSIITSSTGASLAGTDPDSDVLHQRPSWPHNESGTYLPVRSP